MYPAVHGVRLDIDAISGIMGSISIACWLVVFSPQIIENFRRSSAEGLSISFLIIWLLGDLFNILGGVFQGVLPTMLILAVYYTLADIVLLAQVLYYNGFSFKAKDKTAIEVEAAETSAPTEQSPLLARATSPESPRGSHSPNNLAPPHQLTHTNGHLTLRRNSSGTSFNSLLHTTIDGVHLSPATPLLEGPTQQNLQPTSALQTTIFNVSAILLVCIAGIGGWFLAELRSQRSSYDLPSSDDIGDDLEFDVLGQVFGYLCAVLYLGSRVPQLLLNFRRKSTEGVSMLFFLFACVGNLTYVLSIFAFEPACAKLGRRRGEWDLIDFLGHGGHKRNGCAPGEWGDVYGRYISINMSWLVGSAGTLLLDAAVFAQFWVYRGNSPVV